MSAKTGRLGERTVGVADRGTSFGKCNRVIALPKKSSILNASRKSSNPVKKVTE